jgi:DNA modification methylase
VIYYQDTHVTIYNCNALMLPLEDDTVQCVVTSPPYYGLRKYSGEQELVWGNGHCDHEWGKEIGRFIRDESPVVGAKQEINASKGNTCILCGAWRGAFGLEPSVAMYVQHTVEVLREIKRVLRPDGVVFWNIGDSYWGGKGTSAQAWSTSHLDRDTLQKQQHQITGMGEVRPQDGKDPVIKPKDLCLIPQRVAIAAQDDGWWIRSIIVWNKPNPMPESVTDRPTESHEYILMLTKSARYYWNQEAVLEPITETSKVRLAQDLENQTGYDRVPGKTNGNMKAVCRKMADTTYGGNGSGFKGHSGNYDANGNLLGNPLGRNLRSVWTFPTMPFKDAHFAVFPEELPKRCILAATSDKGNCLKCGKPWERVVEKVTNWQERKANGASQEGGGSPDSLAFDARCKHGKGMTHDLDTLSVKELGWQPTCKCGKEPTPAVILDPFAGSGTTGKVAKELNRKAVLVDLSAEYCKLAQKRIENVSIPMELGV